MACHGKVHLHQALEEALKDRVSEFEVWLLFRWKDFMWHPTSAALSCVVNSWEAAMAECKAVFREAGLDQA